LNSHLTASCVRNIRTKNYQNLIIGSQVTVKNVRDAFWDTVCDSRQRTNKLLSLVNKREKMSALIDHAVNQSTFV